ncbi:hypothetical protein ACP4OV_008933 [Aristida adscensionis]
MQQAKGIMENGGAAAAAAAVCTAQVAVVTVKRGEPSLVPPAKPTPTGEQYYLSNLDQCFAVIVQTVYCYKAKAKAAGGGGAGDDAAATLRGALARVLVHYHPLAGRLRVDPELMKLTVEPTGEGAVFVEADAACDLAGVGDLTKPDSATLGQLVYSVPGAKNIPEMPLMTAQVTRFKCGGFALGLAMNHCMADGIAAMEFVNSWATMARGAGELAAPPFLDRTVLRPRDPPVHTFPRPEPGEIPDAVADTAALYAGEELLHRCFSFDPDRLERVRALALAGGDLGCRCTTFEALSGLVWRAHARALGLAPEQRTRLRLAVDGRRRLAPPLPRGYFGNAIVPAAAVAAAGELLSAPVSRAAALVREAVRMVTGEYVRSVVDRLEATTQAAPPPPSTLFITTWSRLEFDGADFGWGEPVVSGPVALPEKNVVLFLAHGVERKSINVMISLPATAMDAFQEIMDEI